MQPRCMHSFVGFLALGSAHTSPRRIANDSKARVQTQTQRYLASAGGMEVVFDAENAKVTCHRWISLLKKL